MAGAITISNMVDSDWGEVEAIYEAGIFTGNATFETESPGWNGWDADHLPAPRLVARNGADTAGWFALSAVSDRCVYGGVAEISVYVHPNHSGHGVGSALMEAGIAASEELGIWTLQAGVFPENEASIALHDKHGFRVVGVRERLGQMDGVWRDVVFMERRSTKAGV